MPGAHKKAQIHMYQWIELLGSSSGFRLITIFRLVVLLLSDEGDCLKCCGNAMIAD